MTETLTESPVTNWGRLTAAIEQHDAAAIAELYELFQRPTRYLICRQLGPRDLDDKIHDAFMTVVESIQHGGVREPARLGGFIRTIVSRQVAGYIAETQLARRHTSNPEKLKYLGDSGRNPEQIAARKEEFTIVRTVLSEMSQRDREVLTGFYLRDESQQEMCAKWHLTDTQFRLLKSRAKDRFGRLGKSRLNAGLKRKATNWHEV